MKHYLLMAAALLPILSGCATYEAKPLNMRADLPHQIPHITVDVSTIPLPKSEVYHFDPDDGLDITEVAILAVVNNPDLKLVRDDAGIARAQAFDAGLLPNPQLAAGVDFPTDNVAGSSYTALNLGLNYDIRALLTRVVVMAAAEKKVRQADLTLLWQEWQVIGRARLLFSTNLYQKRRMQVLTEYRNLLADRYERTQKALTDGNITQSGADADMAALADIDRQINDLERKITGNHHALTRLLGLSSDVKLHLAGNVVLPPIDKERMNADSDQLAYRRPDLLALKAGYESRDLRYRQAIIEQFPAIGVGITRANDTSNIHTIGPSVTLDLPLFNRHQGKIAIEQAGRQRLYDEFENRLTGARGGIAQIMDDQQLLEKQLKAVHSEIAVLEASVQNAGDAFAAGNLDERDYIALRTGLFNKTLEQIDLEQSAIEQRIALQILLGGDFPQVFDRERNPS